MYSRAFNKRLKFYIQTAKPDGYGGFTSVKTLLIETWAKIEPLKPGTNYEIEEFGIIDNNRSVMVTVRERSDINYIIEIMSFEYRE